MEDPFKRKPHLQQTIDDQRQALVQSVKQALPSAPADLCRFGTLFVLFFEDRAAFEDLRQAATDTKEFDYVEYVHVNIIVERLRDHLNLTSDNRG